MAVPFLFFDAIATRKLPTVQLFWCAVLAALFLTNPTDSKDYASAVLQNPELKSKAQRLFCSGEPCPTLGSEADYLQSSILDNTNRQDLFFFTTYEYTKVDPGNPLSIGGGSQAEMLGIFNRFFNHGAPSFGFFAALVVGLCSSALLFKDNMKKKA